MIQFGTRARCGTRVDQWVPHTGRGRDIQVISIDTTTSTVDGASALVSGVTVAPGDVVVAVATSYSTNNSTAFSVASTGLTFTYDVQVTGVKNGLIVAHTVITAGATIDVTATTTVASGARFASLWVLVLRGVDNTTPVDVAGASSTLTTSTTWTIPGITTNSARAFILAVGHSSTVNQTITGPAGWTTNATKAASPTQSRALAYREHLPQGATGNCVMTIASTSVCRYATIAFRAAAA